MIEDDEYDPTRPAPSYSIEVDALDGDGYDWCSYAASKAIRKVVEGASFLRLTTDAFLITVRGGQYLHHDRHLETMADTNGFSQHTWNLVVEASEEQMLVVEDGEGMFRHFALELGALVYFSTYNRHMLTRTNPDAMVIILQIDGIGPDGREDAIARMRDVVAERPNPTQV